MKFNFTPEIDDGEVYASIDSIELEPGEDLQDVLRQLSNPEEVQRRLDVEAHHQMAAYEKEQADEAKIASRYLQ